MDFEQTLRERLGREAGALDLPARHPDRAVARARARHRHRRAAAAAGTAVVVTAAAAIAVPIVRKDGSHSTDRAVTPASHGVLTEGPLDLTWSASTAPGVWELNNAFGGDDGSVYALATAPGVRFGDDDPDGHYLRALYKLNDDGTWQATNLDGDRPDASDASSAGGLLYAVSTAPGSATDEIPRLSTSSDGGETWHTDDLTPADLPSDQDVWNRDVAMSIESTGSQTLAMVVTDFSVDGKALFPELEDPTAPYSTEEGPDGVSLVHYEPTADLGVFTAVPPTSVPDGESASTSTVPVPTVPERARPEMTVVRTVPWSDLGVSGQADVASRRQFFLRSGDGWQPVAQDMNDIGPVKLGVVGDRFYLAGDVTKVGGGEGPGLVYTSADGESWTSAELPASNYVYGMGDALVAASYQGGIEYSLDYGTTWQDVDTSATGMTPDVRVTQISGGPLGLAMVAQNDTGPIQLITTADLANWTVTPVSDISGIADVAWATAFVGSDRIVVSAIGHGGPGNNPPAPQATVVGIPARS